MSYANTVGGLRLSNVTADRQPINLLKNTCRFDDTQIIEYSYRSKDVVRDGLTSVRREVIAAGALAFVLACSILPAYSQERSDDLTSLSLEELMDLEIVPIGILESHIHLDGQWMVGYQFMKMNMTAAEEAVNTHTGAHDAQTSAHDSDAGSHDAHMRAETMWMDMHMVMLMYGLTDDLTLMAMIPYQQSSMEMVGMNGMRMSSASEGLGDILLMGHYALVRRLNNYVIGGAGITIPSGSIEASQELESDSRRLGYGMQLGAGVPELVVDLSVVHRSDAINAGAHAEGQWSLGRNRFDYRIGDRYHTGAWLTVKASSWFAPSLHLHLDHQRTITGSDSEIAASMSPSNDPTNYGGTHVGLSPGITVYAPDGTLKGQRLTVRFDFPILERHSGNFLKNGWSLLTGWQWTF